MEKKVCPKCEKEKETTEFYKNKKTKDGLKSWCKICHLADSKKRESFYNETRKKYREEHVNEYREGKKNYYIDNKEKILVENSKWRQSLNGRLSSYKISAKKRHIDWLLTEDEFKLFWNLNCTYCNDEIKTIGIDRIDNKKPYTIDNCQPCCSICNTMKLDLSHEEFIIMINKILKHIQK